MGTSAHIATFALGTHEEDLPRPDTTRCMDVAARGQTVPLLQCRQSHSAGIGGNLSLEILEARRASQTGLLVVNLRLAVAGYCLFWTRQHPADQGDEFEIHTHLSGTALNWQVYSACTVIFSRFKTLVKAWGGAQTTKGCALRSPHMHCTSDWVELTLRIQDLEAGWSPD
mmetsp:Transcript_64876/g.189820  ORF Transcript_64876/g.189820 Transcript_64876/m.189820 type:complete len:170 (+) Transcript_64876:218-727(+)